MSSYGGSLNPWDQIPGGLYVVVRISVFDRRGNRTDHRLFGNDFRIIYLG